MHGEATVVAMSVPKHQTCRHAFVGSRSMWFGVELVIILVFATTSFGEGTMEFYSLKCRSGYRLHTTTADVTYKCVSKMCCLEYCKRHAEDMPNMRYQCKSISYSAAAGRGRCVLSPLRLFSSQSVDTVHGWTVCTQWLGEIKL